MKYGFEWFTKIVYTNWEKGQIHIPKTETENANELIDLGKMFKEGLNDTTKLQRQNNTQNAKNKTESAQTKS